jgi:hypothetical protein
MKQRLLVIILLSVLFTNAQEVNIIPKPYRVETQDGNFTISPTTQLVLSKKPHSS